MKLFKGQKVHVIATVDNPEPDDEGDIRLIIRNVGGVYVKPESIIHAEPAPLDVGDLVTWGSGADNYTSVNTAWGGMWATAAVYRCLRNM